MKPNQIDFTNILNMSWECGQFINFKIVLEEKGLG